MPPFISRKPLADARIMRLETNEAAAMKNILSLTCALIPLAAVLGACVACP